LKNYHYSFSLSTTWCFVWLPLRMVRNIGDRRITIRSTVGAKSHTLFSFFPLFIRIIPCPQRNPMQWTKQPAHSIVGSDRIFFQNFMSVAAAPVSNVIESKSTHCLCRSLKSTMRMKLSVKLVFDGCSYLFLKT
jgi:hypothetical protein